MKTKQRVGQAATVIFGLILSAAAHAQVSERSFRYANANPATHPVTIGAEKFAALSRRRAAARW